MVCVLYKILIDSTEGKAQALVKQFESFDKAWETLKTFYGNAFHQAHATLNKLYNIQAIKERSVDPLTKLIKQVDSHVDTLKGTLEKNDFKELIPMIVIGKFDDAIIT